MALNDGVLVVESFTSGKAVSFSSYNGLNGGLLDHVRGHGGSVGLGNGINDSISTIGLGVDGGGLGSDDHCGSELGLNDFRSSGSNFGFSHFGGNQVSGFRSNVGKRSSGDFSGAVSFVMEEPVVKTVSGAESVTSVSGHTLGRFSTPSTNITV